MNKVGHWVLDRAPLIVGGVLVVVLIASLIVSVVATVGARKEEKVARAALIKKFTGVEVTEYEASLVKIMIVVKKEKQ